MGICVSGCVLAGREVRSQLSTDIASARREVDCEFWRLDCELWSLVCEFWIVNFGV